MASIYVQRARENRAKGYNCAQAVACAFVDHLDLDETTLFKIMEGFGGGMGGKQATCGALSGAVAVIGLLTSGGAPGALTKEATYATCAETVARFEQRAKSLVCQEILTGLDGGPLISCEACVEEGVMLVETLLGDRDAGPA